MPSEDRRIIFSSDEVYNALFALCAQKQIKKPPPGHVTDIMEDTADNQLISIYLENPQDQHKTKAKVEYSRDFLAASLLLFCKGLGIPIPKNGRKTVLIKDGSVMLRVQMGAN